MSVGRSRKTNAWRKLPSSIPTGQLSVDESVDPSKGCTALFGISGPGSETCEDEAGLRHADRWAGWLQAVAAQPVAWRQVVKRLGHFGGWPQAVSRWR